MTAYNKTTLKTYFETGDTPNGTDFANFIDSYVNIVDTTVQTMAGPLNPTELVTARVSATNIIATGTLQVTGITSAGAVVSDSLATNIVSANTVSTNSLVASAAVAVTVSADSVYASAMRSVNGFFGSVGTVSAAGTTQGTAALLTNVINRGAGVADGVTTGFALPANRIGLTQVIINGAASANLWPPTGGAINALSTNAAFAMAANTPYNIYHLTASAYAVK